MSPPFSQLCLEALSAENQRVFPAHTDKYSQIYCILLPIWNALSQLPMLYNWPTLYAYIDAEYGSLDGLYLATTTPSSVPFSGYVPPLFTTLSRSSVR